MPHLTLALAVFAVIGDDGGDARGRWGCLLLLLKGRFFGCCWGFGGGCCFLTLLLPGGEGAVFRPNAADGCFLFCVRGSVRRARRGFVFADIGMVEPAFILTLAVLRMGGEDR